MKARMMRRKRFLLIFAFALLFFHCGGGGHSQPSPHIRGILDLTTLPSASLASPSTVSAAQKNQTKILALALGPDDEWIEAKVAPDGSFAITCKRGHSYTLAFVAEDSQGQRTFLGVAAFLQGDSWFRFIKVGKRDVDLGLVRLTQGEDGLWIGVPEYAPLAYGPSQGEDGPPEMEEPAEVVEGNRIILPQPGLLEFDLVQADASLMSDLYLTLPYELLLIADRDPEPFQVWDFFEPGTEIQLAIEVDGRPFGLGIYRHASLSGYAQVTQISELEWQIAFEDLPWFLADWDFNDLVVVMTLKPVCDFDRDGYEHLACGGSDYCDHDPNNWTEMGCVSCIDEDGDFWFTGCDAYSTISGPDCDDLDAGINPAMPETLCDGIDQNCNGLTDDDPNEDGDAFSYCQGDCDDTNASVYPGALEQCDGIDNQCPGDAGYGYEDENCAGGPFWPVLVSSFKTYKARDVFVRGSYAYVADGLAGIKIINVSDPYYPFLEGSLNTPDGEGIHEIASAVAVQVDENYAYLADGEAGARKIDISNPQSPVLVDTYTLTYAYNVFVGSVVYFLTKEWYYEIYCLSKSDFSGFSVFLRGIPSKIFKVENGYRYIANASTDPAYRGLQIFGGFNSSQKFATPVGTCATPGTARDVYVQGNYAYIADGGAGLQVIDVQNPQSPVLVGNCDTPDNAYGVKVSGNYAYIADSYSGLQIINVSNPSAPVWVGSYETPSRAWNVVVSGSFAYVAGDRDGLHIFHISTTSSCQDQDLDGYYFQPGCGTALDCDDWNPEISPGAPEIPCNHKDDNCNGMADDNPNPDGDPAGYCENDCDNNNPKIYPGLREICLDGLDNQCPGDPGYGLVDEFPCMLDAAGASKDVFASGDLIYVAKSTNGLHIWDVTNPEKPVWIGSYDTPGDAQEVHVSGHYAYIADGPEDLQIIDVSNPSAPFLAGSYTTDGSASYVYVQGNYAYLSGYPNAVLIVDVSNPAAPQLASTYPSSSNEIVVDANYAYLTAGPFFRILNVADPANPFLQWTYQFGTTSSTGVAVKPGYSYWATGQPGLVIIRPGAPSWDGYWNTPGTTRRLALNGDWALLADGPGGLAIINVSNSYGPLLETTIPIPESALNVATSGNYAYVIDGNYNVQIFRIR